VWAWGHNGHGQLGLGDLVHRFVPQKLTAFRGQTFWVNYSRCSDDPVPPEAAQYPMFDCANFENGVDYSSPDSQGRLGPFRVNATLTTRGAYKMTDISAGGFYTIALGHPLGTCTAAASLARKSAQSFDEEKIQMCQNSPKVFSWGLNYNGQLGLGDWRGTQSTPTVLTAFLHRRIVMIKAGFSHVLASALCWGKGFALDRSGNYTCSCAFGYKGIDCSLQCNGGASSPCNRRGTFDWQTRSYDPDRDADYDCEIDGRYACDCTEVASISQQVVCDNVQAAARAVKGTKAMTAVWNALAQVLGATIATSRLAQFAQYLVDPVYPPIPSSPASSACRRCVSDHRADRCRKAFGIYE
jgi:hypothetical protein